MNFNPISVLKKRVFQQNKGRNLVAALAIILTTLMFTTLFVLSRSMYKNLIEMTFRQTMTRRYPLRTLPRSRRTKSRLIRR